MTRLLLLAMLSCAVLPAPTFAAGLAPPQLGADGQAEYRDFLGAPGQRAFAIAPGGAFGWSSAKGDRSEAEREALGLCQANTAQKCVLFASGSQTVFDARQWPQLWGPYANAAVAQRASTGVALGQRFPDLAFVDASSRKASIASLRGKVVIVHFWGSWCGPCRREMPELQALHQKIAKIPDIALVAMQVREPFAMAQKWAKAQRIRLPLADSGSSGDDDSQLRLADGRRIGDREIARNFPTTYVLDRYGLVLFAHIGPVSGWADYEPFLRDAVARSGK